MNTTPETEALNQTVSVRVTPSEKRAVKLVALLRDTTESEVMRRHTIEEIVAEADARRAAMHVSEHEAGHLLAGPTPQPNSPEFDEPKVLFEVDNRSNRS